MLDPALIHHIISNKKSQQRRNKHAQKVELSPRAAVNTVPESLESASMPSGPVDVIFLDVDGVLLPFGGTREGFRKSDHPRTKGCIFPGAPMDALTALLRRIRDITLEVSTAASEKMEGISARGNPVFVLSSTWRARPEFVQDILSSFRAYAAAKGIDDESVTHVWEPHLHSFFDMVDPNYHSTRHDEIYKWVNENVLVGRGKQIISQRAGEGKKKFVVRSWIALDDEDLVNVEGRVMGGAKKHAVQTASSVGMTMEDVDFGVRLVEEQMREFHGLP